MSKDTSSQRPSAPEVFSTAVHSTPSTLPHPVVTAVAMSADAVAMLPAHVMAPDASVRLQSFTELSVEDVTGQAAPDLIVSPLLARGFDATDLLTMLREARYLGRFLVLAPQMPDIALIRSEMMVQAPDINVDIIALDGSSALHLL